jgi:hypothetical protein
VVVPVSDAVGEGVGDDDEDGTGLSELLTELLAEVLTDVLPPGLLEDVVLAAVLDGTGHVGLREAVGDGVRADDDVDGRACEVVGCADVDLGAGAVDGTPLGGPASAGGTDPRTGVPGRIGTMTVPPRAYWRSSATTISM